MPQAESVGQTMIAVLIVAASIGIGSGHGFKAKPVRTISCTTPVVTVSSEGYRLPSMACKAIRR